MLPVAMNVCGSRPVSFDENDTSSSSAETC
jgi:hypothetical protein